MKPLTKEKRCDAIDAFSSTSRYRDLHVDQLAILYSVLLRKLVALHFSVVIRDVRRRFPK